MPGLDEKPPVSADLVTKLKGVNTFGKGKGKGRGSGSAVS